jgi:hypothetical protein
VIIYLFPLNASQKKFGGMKFRSEIPNLFGLQPLEFVKILFFG